MMYIFASIITLVCFVLLFIYSELTFKQVKISYYDNWKGNTNNRTIFIATPRKTKPKNGWPYLIYIQFMDQSGNLEWGSSIYGEGGIVPKRVLYTPGIRFDFVNIQNVLRAAIDQGKKVICVGDFRDDYRFYANCDWGGGTTTDDIINNLCWNNGDNPDVRIFNKLFDDLKTGVYPFDVDYNNMGVFGYSVGSQMVSRMINSFPTTTTDKGNNYPNKIKYGIMLGGGSHRCYDYGYFTNPNITVPSNYQPCNSTSKGCCPVTYTEDIYNGTNVANRPPVLLLQTSNDEGADVNASKYYYDTVKTRLDSAGITNNIIYKNQYPNSDPKIIQGTLHGMVDEQVQVAIDFLKRF